MVRREDNHHALDGEASARERLSAAGLDAHADALLALTAWGVRLLPTLAPGETAAELPTGTSRLGGSPDVASGTPWPAHDGRPMSFVAQIDLEDLAGLVDGELPPGGLLSVWIDPDVGLTDDCHILFTEPGRALTRTAAPEDPNLYPYPAVPVLAQRELTWLPWTSSGLDALGLSEVEWDSYQRMVEGEEPVQRVLGHPTYMQFTEPPADMSLLLQLDSDSDLDYEFGGLGRLRFWISPDDLAARRFDRVQIEYEQ